MSKCLPPMLNNEVWSGHRQRHNYRNKQKRIYKQRKPSFYWQVSLFSIFLSLIVESKKDGFQMFDDFVDFDLCHIHVLHVSKLSILIKCNYNSIHIDHIQWPKAQGL